MAPGQWLPGLAGPADPDRPPLALVFLRVRLPHPFDVLWSRFDRASHGRLARRSWLRDGRAHIEVRSLHRAEASEMGIRLEGALNRLSGVHWAEINAVTGRVVVAFDGDVVDLDDLIEVVESVEEAHGVHQERFPHERPEHPGDDEPLHRATLALGADVVGLGLSIFGSVLQATPIPAEITAVLSLVDSQPRVRRLLEHTVGRPATELGLALANAVAQALSQGPLGLIVDAAQRGSLLVEHQSRRTAWARREPELCEPGRPRVSEAIDVVSRPVPLPGGPVESYSDRAALGSLAAFGVALAATRDPRRSANALLAGLPKAARLGREAFAAQLDRVLSERDVVVMNSGALRLLDRIDTLVIDGRCLRRRRALTGAATSDPMAVTLVEAVRAAGLTPVLAGSRHLAGELGIERTVAGGTRLARSIRDLQSKGHGVSCISTVGGSALAAADLGIGLVDLRGPVPWAADVICGPGLGVVCFLIGAAVPAREVSRRSVALALGGSAVGGVWATAGTRSGAARRAALAVNTAALAAQAAGVWSAQTLGRRALTLPSTPLAWHSLEPQAVLSALGSQAGGLSAAEAARRRLDVTPAPSPAPRIIRAMAAELANPLTPVLAVGAALSGAVGSATDAVLVAGVLTANALLGGAQRLRTEASLERLMQLGATESVVRRDGRLDQVRAGDLVTGDVIELGPGNLVPADGRIIATAGAEVDESALTGESFPVVKRVSPVDVDAVVADRSSMVYEGTTISTGSIRAVVVAAGAGTEAGRARAGVRSPPPSGVETRLSRLTTITLPVTLAAGAGVTAMGLLHRRPLREAVGSGVSLMVAAVPEGLPLLASVAQQSAARRLSSRGALVRNPRTIEALGRVNIFCFDKTGTLTQGQIGLQRVSDGRSDAAIEVMGDVERAVLAIALRASPGSTDGEVLAHATDRAIVEGARRAGVTTSFGGESWQAESEHAFDPARGFHAVLGRCSDGWRIAAKGAPEVLLDRCTGWREGGTVTPLDRASRRQLHAEVDRLAGLGLRVLAVAQGRAGEGETLSETDVRDLDLAGFVALADHVRPTAAAAVATLRRAGVEVAMITGDHPATAAAIADELGILNGRRVLSGNQVAELADADLDAAVAETSVFARVTPAQKVRIVESYQRLGRVVAMTGDGANDAPAIRLADAGIALGARATSSARSAADLVVADDRIETIIDAIVEGRAMWPSVRDALAILVGGNLGEVTFTLAATALTGRSPLSARQLLTVNLLTDLLPAMAIALRPPGRLSPESLLHEGPEASLGTALARDIAVRAAATAGGATVAWLTARATGPAARAGTVGLIALIGTQLGQTAVAGGTSPVVLGSVAISAAALAGIVQTPGVSQFFGCVPLDPVGWAVALGAASVATGASVALPWAVPRIATAIGGLRTPSGGGTGWPSAYASSPRRATRS